MSEERLDYAILISMAMREEAEVMASALRAEGIDAFTSSISYDWHLTLAFGGVQVLVPGAKIEAARAIIRERIREAAEDAEGEPVTRRDRWKLWLVMAYTLGAPALIAFGSQWLFERQIIVPPEPAPALAEEALTYFAAPEDMTEAEQRAVLREYCRDNLSLNVISREEGIGYVTPCVDIFRLQ